MIYSSPKIKSWLIASLDENAENKALLQKLAQHGHSSFLSYLNTPEEFLGTTEWLIQDQHYTKRLPLAFLGEEKTAGAAFVAAAQAPEDILISTIICFNANLDEVDENILSKIHTPTLLIVEEKPKIIQSNEEAAQFIPYCEITLVQKNQAEQMEKLITKWLDHYAIIRKKKFKDYLPHFY